MDISSMPALLPRPYASGTSRSDYQSPIGMFPNCCMHNGEHLFHAGLGVACRGGIIRDISDSPGLQGKEEVSYKESYLSGFNGEENPLSGWSLNWTLNLAEVYFYISQ